MESAVILHDNPDADLDFTLDRGRVEISNRRKDKEPAHVRVRFRKQVWDLTLDPAGQVDLLLYGRWPRGVPFTKNAKDDEPTADLMLIVVMGNVQVKTASEELALHAPPGPAVLHWLSGDGSGGVRVERIEDLPAWVKPGLAALPKLKDITAVMKLLEQRFVEHSSIDEALADSLDSDNPNTRRIAVYGLGALDDLPRLVDALTNKRHPDVRDTAVVALRHWIGRGPGQDMKLYDVLVKDKHYSEGQAEIVLQLLHSFGDSDLARPATYETLIDYLMHDNLAVRQLAHFHLVRQVPAGRNIAYDAAAPEDARKQAYEKWKELVPSGKLPPRGNG
jgi:hypothetical protein